MISDRLERERRCGYMTEEIKDRINNSVQGYYGSVSEQVKKE